MSTHGLPSSMAPQPRVAFPMLANGPDRGQGQEADPRHAQLAQAYLHLALYYLALTDRASAKLTFKVLLRLYRERRLSPEIYPARVIELFEEARAEVEAELRQPKLHASLRVQSGGGQ